MATDAEIKQGLIILGTRLAATGLYDGRPRLEKIAPYDVTIVLRPQADLIVSRRVLQLCVNVLGSQPKLERRDHSWELAWFLDIDDKQRILRLHLANTQGAWWEENQLSTLVDLLEVGLLYREKPGIPSINQLPSGVDYLLEVHQSKQEVKSAYYTWLTNVLYANLDIYTRNCNPTLYKYGLCCPGHMLLVTQRWALYDWLQWFNDDHSYLRDKWDKKTTFLTTVPPYEELRTAVQDAMHPYTTTYDFLKEHYTWQARIDALQLGQPTHACSRDRHVSHHCCPVHLAMSAIWTIHEAWALMLDEHYNITKIQDKEGRSGVGIFSQAWAELLIAKTGISRKDIPFPSYYDKSENVLKYYNI